jgi:hypothetical protein
MSMPCVARRTWKGQNALGPALLLLALMPMFSYFGHWSLFTSEAMGYGTEAEEVEDVEEHAHHCHLGVANCTDQPVPASVRVIPAVIDLPEPELSLSLMLSGSVTLTEHVESPPTEPPRA